MTFVLGDSSVIQQPLCVTILLHIFQLITEEFGYTPTLPRVSQSAELRRQTVTFTIMQRYYHTIDQPVQFGSFYPGFGVLTLSGREAKGWI